MTSLELAECHADTNKAEANFVNLHELFSLTERKIYWIVGERGKEEKYPLFSITPFFFILLVM